MGKHLDVASGAGNLSPFGLLGLIANVVIITLLGLPGLLREMLAKCPGLRHNDSKEPRWQLSTGNGDMMLS